jgi:hypothetical protein
MEVALQPLENEDELRRPPPPQPYSPVQQRLKVPTDALSATVHLLQKAGRRESGLFWYGTRDAVGNATVLYVVAPKQTMTWGNYHITSDALSAIVHKLPDDWRPLAQIHSHPGIRVEHSNYDDRMASSRKSLSLVFPSYGKWNASFPEGIGVHEWQNDYWYLLGDRDAARRVMTITGAVKVDDFR